METTIKVSSEVKAALDRMKLHKRETYNDVIELMIENDQELNERTKKELEARKKNPQLVSHENARRRLGL